MTSMASPKPSDRPRIASVRRWRSWATRVGFLSPFYIPFALFFLLPIGYAVVQSTLGIHRSGGVFGTTSTYFEGFGQYLQVFADPDFQSGILRVVLFAVFQVPVMIVASVAIALLLDATAPRVAALFRSLYFLPYAVPGVIAALMWGALYVPDTSPLWAAGIHIDLVNSQLVLPAMANIGLWAYGGYNVILFVTALTAVPTELYEAAKIDGASAWRIALSVKLPLIRPTIVMAVLFNSIGTLQVFTEPEVFRTISRVVSSGYTPNMLAFNAAVGNGYNYAAAVSVTLAVVTFIISFGFLRLVQGRGRA